MKVHLNPFQGILRNEETGDVLRLGHTYPLLDAEGYSFTITQDSNGHRIAILCGNHVVQSAYVPTVGSASGELPLASTFSSYVFDLHPEQPIYLIGPLITQLLEEGIEEWRIRPVSDPELSITMVASKNPLLMSDGQVTEALLPATAHVGARVRYSVSEARWAVMTTNGTFNLVYLWPEAVQVSRIILAMIRKHRILP